MLPSPEQERQALLTLFAMFGLSIIGACVEIIMTGYALGTLVWWLFQ